MVKYILALCLSIGAAVAWGAGVSVSASIDEMGPSARGFLRASVVVIHESGQAVETSSFEIDGHTIDDVRLVSESSQTSVSIVNGRRSEESVLISTYAFQIEGGDTGLYTLPPIAVRVGGSTYRTNEVVFEVRETVSSGDFMLRNILEGDDRVFPGQRVKLGYLIRSKLDIALTCQEMPLLEAAGFRLVGERQVEHGRDGPWYVQKVVQEVEALGPGAYVFGPSVLEGYAYREDFFGERRYEKNKLRAEAAPLTVMVEAFPEEGRPSFFKGAVGCFEVSAGLETSREVFVGDKVRLNVKVTRLCGPPLDVLLPDIAAQPGFEGFRFSDIPPVGLPQADSVVYKVEMRPLTADIDRVPSISFAYFDPARNGYEVVATDPLDLKVRELPTAGSAVGGVDEGRRQARAAEAGTEDWRALLQSDAPIPIGGCYKLTEVDLKGGGGFFLAGGRVFYMVPLGFLLLAAQVWARRLLVRAARRQAGRRDSRALLKKACACSEDAGACADLFEKALLLLLYERGHLSVPAASFQALPEDGVCGRVRDFLVFWQERRFCGEGSFDHLEFTRSALSLYEAVKKEVRR